MATPPIRDLAKRPWESNPEIPAPPSSAPSNYVPMSDADARRAASPWGQFKQGLLNLPSELAGAARDAVSDPLDAASRATAPFAGGYSAGAGNAMRGLRATASGVQAAHEGAVPLSQVVKNARPSALQILGTSTGGGGLALGAATLARADASNSISSNRPQVRLIENGESLPESALTPPTPFNQVKGAPSGGVVASAGQVSPNFFYGRNGLRSLPATLQADRDAAVKAADAVVPQVGATGSLADRIGMRSRTQGGIIANPNAMSAVDRIASLGNDPRLKGSPSLRRMAAEQIMSEDGRGDASRQAELNANQQSDAALAKMQSDANESFANRRLKADVFNADAREGRRTADQTFQLGVADRMLQASGLRGMGSRLAGAQAASGKPISDRYDELRDDYLKRNPSASWAEASQFAADTAASEGAKATDSRGVYGADRLRAAGYSQAMADADPSSASWFGTRWGRKAVNALSGMSDGSGQTTPGTDSDPSDYTFRPIGLRERFASALLPGVDLTDDVVATDSRTGRSRLVPSSVLGGQSPDATNILNRFRRQNQGLGD